MSDKPDEVVLRFRSLPDSVPWPERVRQLLKYALRACRLRCIKVEGLPAIKEANSEQQENPT